MGLDLYAAKYPPRHVDGMSEDEYDAAYEGAKPWHVVGMAYSTFMAVRRKLAEEEGLDLDRMAGFFDQEAVARSLGLTPAQVGGAIPWDTTTTTLRPLLNHSDCDGILRYDECEQMIPRLREIAETWPDDDYVPWGMERRRLVALIEGMEWVAENRGALLFR